MGSGEVSKSRSCSTSDAFAATSFPAISSNAPPSRTISAGPCSGARTTWPRPSAWTWRSIETAERPGDAPGHEGGEEHRQGRRSEPDADRPGDRAEEGRSRVRVRAARDGGPADETHRHGGRDDAIAARRFRDLFPSERAGHRVRVEDAARGAARAVPPEDDLSAAIGDRDVGASEPLEREGELTEASRVDAREDHALQVAAVPDRACDRDDRGAIRHAGVDVAHREVGARRDPAVEVAVRLRSAEQPSVARRGDASVGRGKGEVADRDVLRFCAGEHEMDDVRVEPPGRDRLADDLLLPEDVAHEAFERVRRGAGELEVRAALRLDAVAVHDHPRESGDGDERDEPGEDDEDHAARDGSPQRDAPHRKGSTGAARGAFRARRTART
jgi:hypothetical protein